MCTGAGTPSGTRWGGRGGTGLPPPPTPMNKYFYEASARAAARTGRAQGALRLQGSKAHKAHTCSTPAGAPGRNGRSTCLCETR